MEIHAIKTYFNCLPCLYLCLDSTPPLCRLIGSFLIAFQLWAAIWVESVELGSHLFGTVYLRLQGVKDVLVLHELSLPFLGKKKKTKSLKILTAFLFIWWLCVSGCVTPSWSLRLLMAVMSAGTISSSLSLLSFFLTWLSASSRLWIRMSIVFNLRE